jgi:hypothetical protein
MFLLTFLEKSRGALVFVCTDGSSLVAPALFALNREHEVYFRFCAEKCHKVLLQKTFVYEKLLNLDCNLIENTGEAL